MYSQGRCNCCKVQYQYLLLKHDLCSRSYKQHHKINDFLYVIEHDSDMDSYMTYDLGLWA